MKIPRQYLLDTLTLAELPPALERAMQDVGKARAAAILTAIAGAESSYDLEAVGDGGDSLGLWQINTPAWGDPPQHWQVLGSQLVMVGPPAQRLMADPIRFARRTFDVKLSPNAEATVAQIAWQYGAAVVKAWIRSNPTGLTAQDFVRFLRASDRPHQPDWRQRSERVQSELNWALGRVAEPEKKKGVLGTAGSFWGKKLTEQRRGPGNLAGWLVLGLVGVVAINRVLK